MSSTAVDLNARLAGDGPVSVLAEVADVSGWEQLHDQCWDHLGALAGRCVGIVVVSPDAAVRHEVLQRAGTLPFPLTALADTDQAAGWLAGQQAAGPLGVRPSSGGRTVAASPRVEAYVQAHLNPSDDPVLRRLVARTEALGLDETMAIGDDEGQLLQLLVEVSGARDAVEVGTFTGTSAVWLARGLPKGGRLTCFELDPQPIELARAAWREAGVDERIDVVLGPALDSLAALPAGPSIDLAFLDAQKDEYAAYVELLLPRLRPGGMIVVDNVLWGGSVADPRSEDPTTLALRAFNDGLTAREDLRVLMLTVGDGVTVIRRR